MIPARPHKRRRPSYADTLHDSRDQGDTPARALIALFCELLIRDGHHSGSVMEHACELARDWVQVHGSPSWRDLAIFACGLSLASDDD